MSLDTDLVVGGIENPFAIVCGDELSPNVTFDYDDSGVEDYLGVVQRVFVSDQVMGDYALKLTATSDNAVFAIPFYTGETAGDLDDIRVFASLMIKQYSESVSFSITIGDEDDGTGNNEDWDSYQSDEVLTQHNILASNGGC